MIGNLSFPHPVLLINQKTIFCTVTIIWVAFHTNANNNNNDNSKGAFMNVQCRIQVIFPQYTSTTFPLDFVLISLYMTSFGYFLWSIQPENMSRPLLILWLSLHGLNAVMHDVFACPYACLWKNEFSPPCTLKNPRLLHHPEHSGTVTVVRGRTHNQPVLTERH